MIICKSGLRKSDEHGVRQNAYPLSPPTKSPCPSRLPCPPPYHPLPLSGCLAGRCARAGAGLEDKCSTAVPSCDVRMRCKRQHCSEGVAFCHLERGFVLFVSLVERWARARVPGGGRQHRFPRRRVALSCTREQAGRRPPRASHARHPSLGDWGGAGRSLLFRSSRQQASESSLSSSSRWPS